MSYVPIESATEVTLASAADLLSRFFREEGFDTPAAAVRTNTRTLAADPWHWVSLAWLDGHPVGVVTVTTALYVE